MGKLKLILRSYGLKSNKGEAAPGFRSIPVADLYLDCRGVVEKGVPGGTGSSPVFQEGVEAGSPTTITSFHRIIEDSMKTIVTRRNDRKDPYEDPYVIIFLCAHGIHRSVASKHLLARRLKAAGYDVRWRESKLPPQI